ncbi:MAG: hypothetical protein J7L64_04485 [Acidobacteria bacterium]|nr:hypothetical protein [Acidobacteriota bacterium]
MEIKEAIIKLIFPFKKKSTYIILASSIILILLSYQTKRPYTAHMGTFFEKRISGFRESVEEENDIRFRWTLGDAEIRLPIKDYRGALLIEINSARKINTPARAEIYVDGRLVGEFTQQSEGYTTRSFLVPERKRKGELAIRIITHTRGPGNLGIAVNFIRVKFISPSSFLMPETPHLLSPFIILLLILILYAFSGLPRSFELPFLLLGVSLSILVPLIFGILGAEFILKCFFLVPLNLAFFIAIPLLGRKFPLLRLEQGGKTLLFSLILAGSLIEAIVLFTPAIEVRDLMYYYHRLLTLNRAGIIPLAKKIALDRARLWSLGIPFPFSPFYFVLLYPFALLINNPFTAIKLTALTFDLVGACALFLVVRRLGGSLFSSGLSTLFFFLLPLEPHILHYGLFSNRAGEIMSIIALSFIALSWGKLGKRGIIIISSILIALLLLSYPSNLLGGIFLLPTLAISSYLFFEKKKRSIIARAIIISFIIGVLLSLIIYYGYFLKPTLNRIIEMRKMGGLTLRVKKQYLPQAWEGKEMVRLLLFDLTGIPFLFLAVFGIYSLIKRKKTCPALSWLTLSWVVVGSLLFASGFFLGVFKKQMIFLIPALIIASGEGGNYLLRSKKIYRLIGIALIALSLFQGVDFLIRLARGFS